MRLREWLVMTSLASAVAACSDDDSGGDDSSPAPDDVGTVCLAGDEWNPIFAGFAVNEINIETKSARCETGLCIANHFLGRASCPYGQTAEQASTSPQCFLPDSDEAVSVAVEAQFLTRRAEVAMTCSCQCGGTGEGPFCACPSGTTCEDLLGGQSGGNPPAKYCIPRGGLWDPTDPPDQCNANAQNCGDPRPY